MQIHVKSFEKNNHSKLMVINYKSNHWMRQISFNDFCPWMKRRRRIRIFFGILFVIAIPVFVHHEKKKNFTLNFREFVVGHWKKKKERERKNMKCGWLSWIEANFLHDIINFVLYTLLTLHNLLLLLLKMRESIEMESTTIERERHFITILPWKELPMMMRTSVLKDIS